jgi:anti-sigma regulatory factor (Ser/Thr protein kinase)
LHQASASGLRIVISNSSQTGEARRAAVEMARRAGFNLSGASDIAIVVTELAVNVLRHAAEGEIVLQLFDSPGGSGLDVLALDTGPGIEDVGKSLQDGVSTGGGQGTGLGAIARLSHQFDVYSRAGAGTAMLARFWKDGPIRPPPPRPRPPLQFGAIVMPKPGQTVSGDACGTAQTGSCSLAIVADGLGHGPIAAEGAVEAVRTFHDEIRRPFDFQLFFQRAHGRLLKTRGAAVAVAEVDSAAGVVRYCGIGNICGSIITEDGKTDHRMVSQPGTVGHQMRKVQEFQYRWPGRCILEMHSDGLQTSAVLRDDPGLTSKEPVLIAGVLYRNFKRGRDDACVVVGKDVLESEK